MKGFARQVSHHTEVREGAKHPGAYACAEASLFFSPSNVRLSLLHTTILANLLLISLVLIVVSLIIL